MNKAISMWDFGDAPEHLRALSTYGGDEDGVLMIPPGVEAPWWIEKLWNYDCIEPITLPDGSRVYIWSHA